MWCMEMGLSMDKYRKNLLYFSKLNTIMICLMTTLSVLIPSQVQSSKDFQRLWSSAIPLLDDFLERADTHAELPRKKLFGQDQASNLKKMNELKASILNILLESELVKIWKSIEKLEQGVESDRAEIASLREKRITAPEKSRIPLKTDQEGIDRRIESLQERIAESEKLVERAKTTLFETLKNAGIDLNREQFEAMLAAATSDEIVDLIALSENLRAIVVQLAALMEGSGEDLAVARRYYGLYTVLLEVYIFAHDEFLGRLDNHYLPGIAEIKQEAEETIKSAQSLLRDLPRGANGDKAVLQANIEANKLTIRVADLYHSILTDQKGSIAKDKSVLERSLKVAQNTYKTVKISSRMVALVRTGLQEFELLGNMRPPDLRIFANVEMKNEFHRLTGKLRGAT